MSSEPVRPLAVTGALLDGETMGLRCEGGTIAALGPGVAPEAGDETIEAAGAPLVSPLVNGHTHAAMTLFRGYGGDLPLMRWLQEVVWPVEAKLEPEDVYWGTRLACAEMIRTGTTRFWDMYWHPGATARAVRDAGLRATIGGPLFDLDGKTAAMQESALANLDELADFAPAIYRSLAPHAIYTVSEGLLRWIAEVAAERGVAAHIHLSETEQEVSDCLEQHGVRPAAYLDRLGFLNERTVLAHGVWFDRAELELVAERGCTVVTNPVANMKLAVGGVFPYPAAREAGVAVGLGTDGPGSNDSLDLLADLKVFALAQRHATGDATVLPAVEAWQVATGARAPLLTDAARPAPQRFVPPVDTENVAAPGALPRVGGAADFLLLQPRSPELGLGDLHSDLVYAASGSIVDTTVVSGRVLMRGGEVAGVEEIVARAAERSRRLGIG
jgi:5-methylthioadenosine/S-adenosylhomocysteine deaminase